MHYFFDDTGNNNVNGVVRMTKVSKLYKLVKITRLIRMMKLIKNKKKLVKKMNNIVQGGAAFERLTFFLLLLFLIVHFIGCLWILQARFNEEDSWIINNEYQELPMFELYTVALYFTMQTLTTVGYGDVSLDSSTERFFVILLQFIGIILFSFASGSLTTIIANYDSENAKNREKTDILNKILH
jgi:hypothetical protein